ncbi:hypothetical protein [Xenorhabdus bovienii]|uniref:hypothetical protein n=1 Tax=Xenorhabdus bovienii TaxID=40576 RepID=UPI0023B25638|nr:hypothetical protein [Xenorhabdus bovienii]MDE9527710.1 hypothetical protein [Xenorhabdus bovienii]
MSVKWKLIKNKKVIFSIVIIAIVSIYHTASYKWDVKDAITSYVDNNCEWRNECLVDFRNVIPFEWDRAYIFQPGDAPENINIAIGMKYNFVDVGLKFIFIKGNEIVYSEEYFPDPEFEEKAHIYPKFNNEGSNFPDYYYITKENSKIFIQNTSTTYGARQSYVVRPSNEYQSEKNNSYKIN